MTVACAAMLVVLRRRREATMIPAAWLSMLLAAALSWPLSFPATVGPRDLLCLVLFGGQMGLGLLLLTIGSRLVPATENALIGTLDTPLSPLWVWLVVGEVPTRAALVGGTLVLGAVVGHIVVERRRAPGLEGITRPSTGGRRWRA